jgi:hypothetical protein
MTNQKPQQVGYGVKSVFSERVSWAVVIVYTGLVKTQHFIMVAIVNNRNTLGKITQSTLDELFKGEIFLVNVFDIYLLLIVED